MKKHLIILFTFIFVSVFALPCYAQHNSIKQEINNIKLDTSFVFGEACNSNDEIATEDAISDLLGTINSLRNESGLNIIKDNSIIGKIQKISYSRGNIICAFVFVRISNIVLTNAKSTIKQDTIKLEDVVVENNHLEEIIHNVIEREMVENVWEYLSNMKTKGFIKGFDKAKSLSEIPEESYVIIYNNSFEVVAILTPINNGQRKNVKTGKIDAISNYKGHGAIWLIL